MTATRAKPKVTSAQSLRHGRLKRLEKTTKNDYLYRARAAKYQRFLPPPGVVLGEGVDTIVRALFENCFGKDMVTSADPDIQDNNWTDVFTTTMPAVAHIKNHMLTHFYKKTTDYKYVSRIFTQPRLVGIKPLTTNTILCYPDFALVTEAVQAQQKKVCAHIFEMKVVYDVKNASVIGTFDMDAVQPASPHKTLSPQQLNQLSKEDCLLYLSCQQVATAADAVFRKMHHRGVAVTCNVMFVQVKVVPENEPTIFVFSFNFTNPIWKGLGGSLDTTPPKVK